MLTALSLAAALSAQSQSTPPTPPTPPRVETRVMVVGGPGGEGPGSLDKDGDGQISREEFSAPLNDAFGRMDKNGDGRLSDEEMRAGHGGPDGDGNMVFMRHPGPGGPGGDGEMVFMRHPGGPEGPGGPGMHRFEVRRENVNGEETVRVFTRGENGEMVEVEGGLDAANLPDGVRVRMMEDGDGPVRIFTRGEGGDGEQEITIVTRGGPGGEMRGHPMPVGDGNVMVWTSREGGPGERRVEVRTTGGPGGAEWHAAGPGAPRMEMHRIGGPDGPGDMDKDGDGRVTEDEFLAPMREAFRQMDADHSGAIDAGERGASGDHRVHVITRSEERRSGE